MSDHRLTLTHITQGKVQQNVVHVLNPDGTLTDTQIKDEFVTNWINVVRVHVGTQTQFSTLEVRRILTPTPPAPTTFPIGITGGGSATNLPLVCCEKLQFTTGVAGRQGRGRYFIPNVSTGAFDGTDRMTTSEITKINATALTLANRWKSGGSGPLTLTIAHKNGSPPTPVTDIRGMTTIGVQRRRNVGVGI